MGRHKHKHHKSRKRKEEFETDSEDENPYTYTLMPDTKSPFSCCCICYRYLLDIMLILALSPFIVNCFVEAVIYLVKFDWGDITGGKAIFGIVVVSMWLSIGIFGILCCIAVIRKGVFTRRIRQRRKDGADIEETEEGDSIA